MSQWNAAIEAAAADIKEWINARLSTADGTSRERVQTQLNTYHNVLESILKLKRPEAVNDRPHIVTYETMTPDQIKEIIQEYRDDKEQLAHDFKTLWRNLNKHQLNRLSFMSNLGKNLQKEMREIYDIPTPKEPKP